MKVTNQPLQQHSLTQFLGTPFLTASIISSMYDVVILRFFSWACCDIPNSTMAYAEICLYFVFVYAYFHIELQFND